MRRTWVITLLLAACGEDPVSDPEPTAPSAPAPDPAPLVEERAEAREPAAGQPPAPREESAPDPRPLNLRDFDRQLKRLLDAGKIDQAAKHVSSHEDRLGRHFEDRWSRVVMAALQLRDETWEQVHAALREGTTPDIEAFAREVEGLPELAPDVRGLRGAIAAGPPVPGPAGPRDPAWTIRHEGEKGFFLYDFGLVATGDLCVYASQGGTKDEARAYVVAVDRQTGKPVWERATPLPNDNRVVRGRLVGTDDRIAHSIGPRVIVRRTADGTSLWERTLEDVPVVQELVLEAKELLVVGPQTIHAMDADTGEPRWSWQSGESAIVSAGVAGGRVYAATLKGTIEGRELKEGTYRLVAIDGGRETELGQWTPGKDGYPWAWSRPVLWRDRVFVACVQYRIEPSFAARTVLLSIDGDQAETRILERHVHWGFNPYIARLFVHEGRLHLVHASDERKVGPARFLLYLASFDTRERYDRIRIETGGLRGVPGAGGPLLYSFDHRFRAHETRTGLLRWMSGPPQGRTRVTDREVLVVPDQHRLVCFRADRTSPTFHDLRVPEGSFVGAANPGFEATLRDGGSYLIRGRIEWENLDVSSIRTRVDGEVVPHAYDGKRGKVTFRHGGEPFGHLEKHAYSIEATDKAGNTGRTRVGFTTDLEPPHVTPIAPVEHELTTLQPRIEALVKDGGSESGLDPGWVEVFVDGQQVFDPKIRDGRVEGWLVRRKREPGGRERPGIRNDRETLAAGERIVEVRTRDKVGNVATTRWAVTASPDLTELYHNLDAIRERYTREDEPVLDVDTVRTRVTGLRATAENVALVRRLLHVTRVMLLGHQELRDLSRKHANAFYEIWQAAFLTTRHLEEKIAETEESERAEAERKKKEVEEDAEGMLRGLESKSRDLGAKLWDTVRRRDPTEKADWKERLAAIFMDDYYEEARTFWEAVLQPGAAELPDLDAADAALAAKMNEIRGRAGRARTKYHDAMQKANDAGAPGGILGVLENARKKTAGKAGFDLLVDTWFRLLRIKNLRVAVEAAADGYLDVRAGVVEALQIPFGK